jgi:hypothetical protein
LVAKATASTYAKIELPTLDVRYANVNLIGDSSLIVHAWSQKAKREMLDTQMKCPKQGHAVKDPIGLMNDSLYELKGGGYGFPSVGFKSAAVTAVTSVSGVTKVGARQAFHILGEAVLTKAVFDPDILIRQDVVRIEGVGPNLREDMVKIGMGTADLRYRGEFWPWFCTVGVRYNANLFSMAQIVNLLNTSGFAVGVGEWRPERDGDHGMFHVALEGELKNLKAEIAADAIAA